MDWKQVLIHFGYGWGILVSAILINGVVKWLGGRTWYDYFNLIFKNGVWKATTAFSIIELAFLFIIYPALFGLLIYLMTR